MPNRKGHVRFRDKVSKACERCRLLKVKCSGTHPCLRCSRKEERCRFAVDDKRVSVPESYLRELQSRHGLNTPISQGSDAASVRPHVDRRRSVPSDPAATGRLSSSSSGARPGPEHGPALEPRTVSGPRTGGQQPSDTSPASSIEPGFRQNPLADNDYTFASAAGRYWYMGPTSSWSFCRRVLAMLGKRIPEAAPDPWHRPDQGAYPMHWTPLRPDESPDVSNLPPLDYALHLLRTAKYYLGNLFAVIDEAEFTRAIHDLYEDPAAKARANRTWYALFLLVLAFGKAFPAFARSKKEPPGATYAQRAMTMLPDMTALYADPVVAGQTLVLAALYFQSLDNRVAAYYHISHALRVCIIEGMHRYMPDQVVDPVYAKRCNVVFWVIYVLEREFSALIGAPSAISDEAITAMLPSQTSQTIDAMSMSLTIRLARMTARLLTTVYGVGKQFDDSLIPNTQSIIRDLARLCQDITDLLRTHFQGSVTKASRMAQKLMISYHHCVVLSTRPLVMCALQMHIENTDMQLTQAIPLTPTVASLLHSCVDSAQTVLKMLRVLGEEDMLDAFLPAQLDAAYSSAFILHLIRLISPTLFQDDDAWSWSGDIDCVLDKMIADGSLVAPLRKLELNHLESVMSALSPPAEHQQSWGLTPGLNFLQENGHHGAHHGGGGGGYDPQQQQEDLAEEDMLGDPFWDTFVTNGMSGMPPQELLDLADRLDDAYVPEGAASVSTQ